MVVVMDGDGDGGDGGGGGTATCDDCVNDFTAYGSECCDTAWDEFGLTCAQLEANYLGIVLDVIVQEMAHQNVVMVYVMVMRLMKHAHKIV